MTYEDQHNHVMRVLAELELASDPQALRNIIEDPRLTHDEKIQIREYLLDEDLIDVHHRSDEDDLTVGINKKGRDRLGKHITGKHDS